MQEPPNRLVACIPLREGLSSCPELKVAEGDEQFGHQLLPTRPAFMHPKKMHLWACLGTGTVGRVQ